jgi:hypothetical protein
MNSTRHGQTVSHFHCTQGRAVRQAATRSNPIMSRAVQLQQQMKRSDLLRFHLHVPRQAPGPPSILIWYKFIRIDRDLSLRALDRIFEFKISPMCRARAVGSSVVLPPACLPTAVAVFRHGLHMVSEKEAFGCTKHADMLSIFSFPSLFLEQELQ